MIRCDQVRGSLHLYIDGEMDGPGQLSVEAHLLECAPCRAEYDSVRDVVDTVRGSKPLYQPSPALAEKLEGIVKAHRAERRKRVQSRVWAAAACAAIAVLLISMLPEVFAKRFTSFAADAHLRFERGALALAVRSAEPREVSAWLETHLPFPLALPNYPAEEKQPKGYSLIGAKVLRYEGHDVAYLAYRMGDRPISLLVSSDGGVEPSRGATHFSGKLAFHFSSEQGLKLITWRDRGLSYALVSDEQSTGAQSCIVCHGSEAERQKFENLFRVTPPQF